MGIDGKREWFLLSVWENSRKSKGLNLRIGLAYLRIDYFFEKLRDWGSLGREGDKIKFVDVRFKR